MENLEPKYRIIRARGRNNLILDVLIEITLKTDKVLSVYPQKRSRIVFDESENISSDISCEQLIDLCITKLKNDTEGAFNYNIEKMENSINQSKEIEVYNNFEFESLNEVKIQSIPKLYAKIILIREGLWSTVENYFSQENIDLEHKVFFEESRNWERNNILFQYIVNNILQLSEEQIDDLFRKAYMIYKENNSKVALNSFGDIIFPTGFDNYQ